MYTKRFGRACSVVCCGVLMLCGCSSEPETPVAPSAQETPATPTEVASIPNEPAPAPTETPTETPTVSAEEPAPERSGLLAALAGDDNQAAQEAAMKLAERGGSAVAELTAALNDPETAHWACAILAEIGPAAEPAAPALAKVVEHEAPDMRMQALVALAAIGPGAASAEAAVVKALDDETAAVRYAAALAAGKIGLKAALPKLKEQRGGDDAFLNTVSAWAIAKISPDDEAAVKEAIELLVAGVKSDDVQARRAAARGIFELNAPPEIVGEALVEALQHADAQLQANIIDAVAALGAKAVPRIVERGLKNEALRHTAVLALAEIGPDAKEAVPALVELLGSDDEELKRDAQYALGEIGPASKQAVPELVKSLESENDELVTSACFALGKIGPDAAEAVSAIKEHCADAAGVHQLVGIWALLQIEPDNAETVEMAIPLLTAALESDKPLVRYEAASALGRIGPQAASATEALKKLESDDDQQVAKAATEALAKISS